MDDNLNLQEKEIALRDKQAESYYDFWRRTRGQFSVRSQIKTILNYLTPCCNETILDAGCGVGIYSLALAEYGSEVIAVDFSEKSIILLNKMISEKHIANIQTHTGDLQIFDFGSERFDKAISIEVLQHIPAANKRVQVLKNIRDSLKPGGLFVLVVYRWGGWINPPTPKEDFNHIGVGLYRMAFTPGECRDLLKEAGFQVVRIAGLLNLPKKIRKRLPPSLAFIESWISRLPFSAKWGDYLLAVGKK